MKKKFYYLNICLIIDYFDSLGMVLRNQLRVIQDFSMFIIKKNIYAFLLSVHDFFFRVLDIEAQKRFIEETGGLS